MAQEINELGSIMITASKNVIFKKRMIQSIFVNENEDCVINFLRVSDDGEENQVITIPYSRFSESVEGSLWDLIDQSKEKEK